jgi:hypothetical protein
MDAWEELKETDALRKAKQAERRERDEVLERLRKDDNKDAPAPTTEPDLYR